MTLRLYTFWRSSSAWRVRIGLALKGLELAWAADNGFDEVLTWTQRGNQSMRALNERLGYEYRTVALKMMTTVRPA